MRKIVLWITGTVSGLVLLFSYHTSTVGQAANTTAEQPTDDTTASGASTPNAAQASGGTSSSSGTGSAVSGTFTGDAVATRCGTVQVQIVVKDGKITSADAIQYPNENPKDQKINAYAVPQLNAEVVDAQSASIDAVSGATVTSGGYITSLQSAIDQAHLK